MREKKGISQIEMARRLETGNSQIRKVEVGANSSIIMLMRIAKELDTTIEKLVKGL
ncbi:MAG: helix-turn-helix domain-containing protein [Methanobacterium sp.]